MNVRPVVLVAALFAPLTAQAQTPEELATRAELLRQAEEARQADDHARALDLASRAGRLRMTPSVRLVIAQEHSALGHLLEALALATRCAAEARGDAQLNNRERILAACTALSTEVRGQVAQLTFDLPTPRPPGLDVTIQGQPLTEDLWSVPYPVLPGAVSVDATAPNLLPFHETFTVRGGETRAVLVRLRAPSPALPAVSTPAAASRSATPRASGTPVVRVGVGPLVVAGAGVASFALAGFFYGLRAGAVRERDASLVAQALRCDEDASQCEYAEALQADARARTYNLLTNIALGVGITAVVGGAVWWLLGGRRGERRPNLMGWSLVPTAGGLSLGVGGEL